MVDNAPRRKNYIIEGARIMWRNFAGAPDRFNDDPGGNFTLFLSEHDAEQMAAQGYNVKRLDPRDPEDGDGQPILRVKVKFNKYPPNVVLVTKGGTARTKLDESTVSVADQVIIQSADVSISPSNWTNARGESGIAAYLKSAFLTLEEDALDDKYADLKDTMDGSSIESDHTVRFDADGF